MKEVRIVSWDDLDAAEGKHTEATSTIVLSYNGKHLEEGLRPYLDAGRKPDHTHTPYQRASYRPGSGKARRQELRDWADARGRSDEYKTPKDHFYYKIGLREDFNAWLRAQGRGAEATF
jgi:hypothetical protein